MDPVALGRRLVVEVLVRRAKRASPPMAVARWRCVVEVEATPSARSLLALGKALSAAGDVDEATEVLARGMALYPDNVHLATNWAHVSKDWNESARRWQRVVERDPEAAPPRAWARWADGLRRMGRAREGLDVIDRAIKRMGLHRQLVVVAARCHAQLGHAAEEAKLWRMAMADAEAEVPPFGYRSLAHHHRQRGEVGDATRVVELGLSRHPWDRSLLFARAEMAMVQRDWAAALAAWARYLDALGEDAELPQMRGGSDWHAGDWLRLGRWLVSRETPPAQLRDDVVAKALITTLIHVDSATALDLVAWLGDHRELPTAVEDLARQARSRLARQSIGARGANPSPAARQVEEAVERLLDEARPTVVARIHAPAGSGVLQELMTGRWIDLDAVRAWLVTTSPLSWLPDESVRVSGIQQRVSELVARVTNELTAVTTVPSDVLREALHLPLWQFELLRAPLQQLADDVASDPTSGPVLLPSPDVVRVLDPLDLTAGWPLVLASGLRARGVPVALVHRRSSDVPEPQPLSLGPGSPLLVGRDPQRMPPEGARFDAIFPSGIRSLVDVIEQVGDPLVLTGDAIVSAFAYDRTLAAVVDYRPQLSVLPDAQCLAPRELPASQASVEVGQAQVTTADPGPLQPVDIVRTMLLSPFDDTWKQCTAAVARYGIGRAHIADHLYAGSALFAGAVRHAGGSVTLWPHSTNPVHEDVRAPGSFDRVTAVLASGAARWRATHPEAEVAVVSDLMIDWDDAPTPTDPDAPLNVVVIGGTSTLGLTTFVDPDHHAAAHRELFGALRELADEGAATVWCKPKGGLAEGMWWLEQTVGEVDWVRPMRQHPRRMVLPNLVFVTVSLGSSAIYEGIMRGIPGMVCRAHDVEDYTTIRDGAIPVLHPEDAGRLLADCARSERRSILLAAQVDLLEWETQSKAPWRSVSGGG